MNNNKIDIVVFSEKRYHNDFRKELLQEFERRGMNTIHIYALSDVEIVATNRSKLTLPNNWSVDQIENLLNLYLKHDKHLILTGMGGAEVPPVREIYDRINNAVFIFDVYDNFLYDSRGINRKQRQESIDKWKEKTDAVVVLSKSLKTDDPNCFHVGNASHLKKLVRLENDLSRAIYIGSIDKRVDFAWLKKLANTGMNIEIWGWIHENSKSVKRALGRLVKAPNVSYMGPFRNDDLAEILTKGSVGLIPYKHPSIMTRHINTDKLYHYLNSGMRVISTPIPVSQEFSDYLILSKNPKRLLKKSINNTKGELWNHEQFSWTERAEEFMSIFRRIGEKKFTPPKKAMTGKLHLGAGQNVLKEWINTDILPLSGVTYLDFSEQFPYPDSSLDAVYCEHVIEHIAKDVAEIACREVYRTLKPGGWFRIVTPSIEQMSRLILEPDSSDSLNYIAWFRSYTENHKAEAIDAFNAIFYNHGHKFLYSKSGLTQLLQSIGFTNILTTAPDVSKNPLFFDVSGHGEVIGHDINRFEAFGVEAMKPTI